MAKRMPFTSQEERLERLIKNARREVVALKGMIDTARSVVAAQILKLDDPSSPQIIRVSEEGGLDLGSEGLWRIVDGTLTEEVSHTGDTNETMLHTITVKGNSMGLNGFLRIFGSFRAVGAGNHTFRLRWGGAEFSNYANVNTNLMYDTPHKLIWNRGATNSQGSTIRASAHHTASGESVLFAVGKDTTQDIDITFTVQNAVAAHTAYLRLALVEVFYGN